MPSNGKQMSGVAKAVAEEDETVEDTEDSGPVYGTDAGIDDEDWPIPGLIILPLTLMGEAELNGAVLVGTEDGSTLTGNW
jgi:hypothetical protein